MNAIISNTRLHLNKREATFAVPLYITGMVALISVLISVLFWRAGSLPGTSEWVESSRMNPGMMYGLAGFLVYLGVQSVATTFPFALTLGATRRSFAGGTLLWNIIMSAYLAIVFAAMLMLELLTNHWFAGFYIFDIYILGAGDVGLLVPIVFLSTLFLLTVGGVFGASWVRFGSRGPLAIGIGVGLVIVLALIIVIPQGPAILAAFELWWLAVAAVVAVLASSLGTWALLRSATVR